MFVGCKYNFYPDKPVVRYTVRGLVAGAATLAAPVAAVGAVALLAVGTTIAAPTYGTYRLVKHIRNKRRTRHILNSLTISSDLSGDTSTDIHRNEDDDDEDLKRAKQASLESYQEEQARQGISRAELNESDDDDSFDD